MRRSVYFLLAIFLIAGAAVAQRRAAGAAPKTAATPVFDREKFEKTLEPRTLTVTITVKGSGDYSPSTDVNTRWEVNHTYTGVALMNHFMGLCTGNVLTPGAPPCSLFRWGFDPDKVGGKDNLHIITKVAMHDSLVQTTRYRRLQDENGQDRIGTETTIVDCNTDSYGLNLAVVAMLVAKGTVQVEWPYGIRADTGGCNLTKSKNDPYSTPSERTDSYFSPPYINEFSVNSPKFKGNGANNIEFPLVGMTHLEAAKGFHFDTGEIEAKPKNLPITDPKARVTIRAVYDFK